MTGNAGQSKYGHLPLATLGPEECALTVSHTFCNSHVVNLHSHMRVLKREEKRNRMPRQKK